MPEYGSMLSDRLKSYDFYLDKLTLLLKKSYGIPEQVKLYVDIMRQTESAIHDFFTAIGAENSGVWTLNADSVMINIDGEVSDLLDKIASLVGVSRNYAFLDEPLNNRALYLLIYCKIVQNSFNGTKEGIDSLTAFLKTMSMNEDGSKYLSIEYVPSSSVASCHIYLDSDKLDDSYDVLKTLFEHGFLTLRSMGIRYTYNTVSFSSLGHYDAVPTGAEEGIPTFSETDDRVKYDTAQYGG